MLLATLKALFMSLPYRRENRSPSRPLRSLPVSPWKHERTYTRTRSQEQDIDGKELQFQGLDRPARCYLYFCFVITNLHWRCSEDLEWANRNRLRSWQWSSWIVFLFKIVSWPLQALQAISSALDYARAMDAVQAYSDTLLLIYFHAEKHAHEWSNIFICCLQDDVPIKYDSFFFSPTKRKYATYKRELCLFVKFVVKYDYYCKHPFHVTIIHTNHKPLTHFLSSDKHEGIYEHWVLIN